MVPDHIDPQVHTVFGRMGNWEFYDDDSYEDSEGFIKHSYFARHVPTDTLFDMDHSPYNQPSAAACRAYVLMGFPARRNGGPWHDEKIIAACDEEIGE